MPISEYSDAPAWRPRWERIDTVLLDMDGTLLDLRFDNDFWLQWLPERFAARHGLTVDEARQELTPRFAARQGTLEWYCTDFWSRELGLDVAGLKREMREHVRFLPQAEQFLVQLGRYRRERGLRTLLLTNAHHDSLAIKAAQTQLGRYFDAMVSSHRYGVPKETAEFWIRAQTELNFDPQRSLFVDDSLSVLRSARQHGIAQVVAISQPDSSQARRQITEFPSVADVLALLG